MGKTQVRRAGIFTEPQSWGGHNPLSTMWRVPGAFVTLASFPREGCPAGSPQAHRHKARPQPRASPNSRLCSQFSHRGRAGPDCLGTVVVSFHLGKQSPGKESEPAASTALQAASGSTHRESRVLGLSAQSRLSAKAPARPQPDSNSAVGLTFPVRCTRTELAEGPASLQGPHPLCMRPPGGHLPQLQPHTQLPQT